MVKATVENIVDDEGEVISVGDMEGTLKIIKKSVEK